VSKLPVVDDKGNLVGIITNSDVIRSQIERADPQKVWKLKKTLETLHNVSIVVNRGEVDINDLVPTQGKIFADELEGRIYELKKGLAEPLIVIHKPGRWLLADGHHRVVAAKRLGIQKIDAYILEIPKDIPPGNGKIGAGLGPEDAGRHPGAGLRQASAHRNNRKALMKDRKATSPKSWRGGAWRATDMAEDVLDEVYSVIVDRKENPKDGSYVTSLYRDPKGLDKVLEKIGEEATEVIMP